MQAPDPIETILARLMPPALSVDGQLQIEEMLEDLAKSEQTCSSPSSWLARSVVGGGIAAAFAGLLAALPLIQETQKKRSMADLGAPRVVSLVSESDRIESVTDEGWQETEDGSTMHTLRLNAVEENRVRDEESGMVVQISALREEIFLTPITAF